MAEEPEGQLVQRTLAEQLAFLTENPDQASVTPFPGLHLRVQMHHVHDDVFHMVVLGDDDVPVVVEHNTPPEIAFRFHLLQMAQMALAEKAGPALADEVEAFLASQQQAS
jgi:hypothetical protein